MGCWATVAVFSAIAGWVGYCFGRIVEMRNEIRFIRGELAALQEDTPA